MKELSIEQKAKAYDEAIKRVEDIVGGKCPKPFVFTEGLFDYIFPELKESEDERIRACIGMCLTDIDEQRFADFNTNLKECCAWLKKQGEQKPQGKTALEAIKEEKVDNANKVEPKQEKLTEFEKAVKQVMEEAIECGDTRNLKADAEMLLSLVHKSAWSEEDEKLLDKVIKRLHKYSAEDEEYLDKYYWLIELKHRVQPQNTWKPSDEQMDALENTIRCGEEESIGILSLLYNDLKKLREE